MVIRLGDQMKWYDSQSHIVSPVKMKLLPQIDWSYHFQNVLTVMCSLSDYNYSFDSLVDFDPIADYISKCSAFMTETLQNERCSLFHSTDGLIRLLVRHSYI